MEDLFTKYMNTSFLTYSLNISNNVPQTFVHRFSDGRSFLVYIKYNKFFNNWLMSIYEQNGTPTPTPMALNITMNYGLDLLSQYKYLNLGEFYVIPKNYIEYDSPEYNSLNDKFIYVWRHD